MGAADSTHLVGKPRASEQAAAARTQAGIRRSFGACGSQSVHFSTADPQYELIPPGLKTSSPLKTRDIFVGRCQAALPCWKQLLNRMMLISTSSPLNTLCRSFSSQSDPNRLTSRVARAATKMAAAERAGRPDLRRSFGARLHTLHTLRPHLDMPRHAPHRSTVPGGAML